MPRKTKKRDFQPGQIVGELRQFGPFGPVYEVVRLESEEEAWIRVFHTGEELSYSIKEILADPVAEAV
jgi:hypothetical protein